MRILVVEDDRVQAAGLERVLVKEGHEVAKAFTIEAAIRQLTYNGVDLILLDFMLEGKPALEILRVKMELPRAVDVPVIIITGADPHEVRAHDERTRFPLACVREILGKPIDIARLLARIDTIAAGHE